MVTAAAAVYLIGASPVFKSPTSELAERSEQVERFGLWGGAAPLAGYYILSQKWQALPPIARTLQLPGLLLAGHLSTEANLTLGNTTNSIQKAASSQRPDEILRAAADAYSHFAIDVLSDLYLTAQMSSLGLKVSRLLKRRKGNLPEKLQEGLDRADYVGIGTSVAFAMGGVAVVDGVILEAIDKAAPQLLPNIVGMIYGGASAEYLLRKTVATPNKSPKINKKAKPATPTFGQRLQKWAVTASTIGLTMITSVGAIVGFAQPGNAPNIPTIDMGQASIKQTIVQNTAPTSQNIRVKAGDNLWELTQKNWSNLQKKTGH